MKQVLGFCLNWRAAAVLGAFAVAVWVVAPQLALALLPILLLALCPLSMLFMMRRMGQHEQSGAGADPQARLRSLEREHARVREELERLREQARDAAEGSDTAAAGRR